MSEGQAILGLIGLIALAAVVIVFALTSERRE